MTTSGHESLSGNTALVTGAAKRLGRAIAIALAAAGVNVLVHYRSARQEALDLVDQLLASGVRAWPVQASLDSQEEAEGLWSRCVELAGPVNLLVNNASVFPESRLLDLTPATLYGDLAVNAMAPLILARCFAEQNSAGAIVNMLDTRIVDNDPQHAAYHLSKRTLFTLTRMLALELAPAIRVNAVAPGLILPPEGKDMDYLINLSSTNPLHSVGAPEQVADAVLYLLRAPFVTGQVLFVDGGRHLKGNMYGC